MGDQGYRVEPGAITQYAALIDAQAERIAEIRSRLSSVSLNANDFGKLPNAQDLFDAYQEHAEAEQKNFADLLEIMADTAEGLNDTADNYATTDSDIASVYGGGR